VITKNTDGTATFYQAFGDRFIEMNNKIAQALREPRFVVLERSMDPSNLVNPTDFDREVLAFLEQTDARL
jgi:hypothetical protein